MGKAKRRQSSSRDPKGRNAPSKARDPKGRQAKEQAKRIGPNSAVAARIRAIRPTGRKTAGGKTETVRLASGDRRVWPTLFPNKGGGFTRLPAKAALVEARKRGEVFVTRTVADATALALGAWKPKRAAKKAVRNPPGRRRAKPR